MLIHVYVTSETTGSRKTTIDQLAQEYRSRLHGVHEF
jgi:hypothetical protein